MGHTADQQQQLISIHAPREGGDVIVCMTVPAINIFQSTPPARGATVAEFFVNIKSLHFNPRPPRGGRLPFTF